MKWKVFRFCYNFCLLEFPLHEYSLIYNNLYNYNEIDKKLFIESYEQLNNAEFNTMDLMLNIFIFGPADTQTHILQIGHGRVWIYYEYF